jgi:NitT/TauT family transport system ATP-binding protein
MTRAQLRIGFIPLVDAAALIVAVDKGFAAAEDLDVMLVREVSWANVRDKLNIGLLDAAHFLAPMAIASSLGLGQVRMPIVAPFNLGLNGNAITVSPALHAAITRELAGSPADPMLTAQALARIVADRRRRGDDPLTFGITFPFSTHNYQLRFWMTAGGVDPDEDVRLVVVPPPYMADHLAAGDIDAFCVAAPWSSTAVDRGIGHILHFMSDILEPAAEKVFALRANWVNENPDIVARMIRALQRAADYIGDPENRAEAASIIAAPDRIGGDADTVFRTLEGRLKISPDGTAREDSRYLLLGQDGTARPDPVQAAWLYAQMARWGQAALTSDNLAQATAVFAPALYDSALGLGKRVSDRPTMKAFAGPAFDPERIEAYLAAFTLSRHSA